ncbi:MAG: RtcB family protein [Deltaproteobacteria bacterium]|uniref:tRNA-splicing ligase RtcB n=1 Tax=Candidatus Zymogenus saltonus TaxID=2844893 RepID=A0A9D8KHZ3_9DELT|nr:RtcB family protein [Candidatus Zymogenus saltonus]
MKLKKIDPYRWKIERSGKMRTDGIIYSDDAMIEDVKKDNGPVQVANVATLPGIVGPSLAMPDIHWGYGFPIGGVAAFDVDTGVISPGGVGYDINCGVRLLRSELQVSEVLPKIKELTMELFHTIPSGVGSAGKLRLRGKDELDVLREGARWAVKNGMGTEADLVHTEDGGRMEGADPKLLSERVFERGRDQMGTLGSGNHFIEVGFVDEIYDEAAANSFGLFTDGVVVQIHSGSRGLGYQICDEFLKRLGRVTLDEGIEIPDRQLACAQIKSAAGRDYLSAMACAANYAWANRQAMSSFIRDVFERFFRASPKDLRMSLVYDVCHNIARIERHEIDGKERELCVHRKGATRALPPGHRLVPEVYRGVGQPILIPGDMGTASYVLVGTEGALKETFGSTCHGAGRVMSRNQAKREARGRSIARELMDGGVFVTARGKTSLAEEMPEAYKDVDSVVEVAHNAGISKKVARLKPIGVMKG